MAYDPQNPLEAITGERAKRGKKNQTSRPGEFIGPPTPKKLVDQSKDSNIQMFDVPLVGPTRPEPFVGPPRKTTPNIFSGISTSMNKKPQSEPAPAISRDSIGQMQNMANLGVNAPRVPMQPGYRRPELPSFQVPQPPQSIQASTFVGPPMPTLGQRFFGGQSPRLKFGDVQGQGAGSGLQQTVGKPQLPNAPSQIQGQPSVNPMRYGDVQGQGVQLGLRSAIGESGIPDPQPPLRGQISSGGPGSSPGMMTRGVQQPGLGQVGVNAPTNVPPYLSGDRAALAAMERMRPQTSQRPQQATPPAAQPTAATSSAARPAVQSPAATPAMAQPEQAMIGPERQSNIARADQLRAQIASEQQAMLAARRARGGSFREDTVPLERIAGMRQELAQYERAATPGQPIRVKTPEENLATEQSLARQASDIMARDLGADNIPAVSGQPIRGSAEDLRRQVATMPAGPERDAMAEQLRSLQYQQQQQAARAGALPAGAVGPQPMGASVELAEQMMSEARARTQRQQEAAPRVAARQQELADVAMREGERLTGSRLDDERKQKEYAEALRSARLSEISAPERIRQEAIAGEQAKRAAATGELGIKERESQARIANIQSQTNMTNAQAKEFEARIKSMTDDSSIRRQSAELANDSARLDNELKRAKLDAMKTGITFDPETAALKDAALDRLMKKLGVSSEDEAVVQQAADGLKQNIDKTTYVETSEAVNDLQRAMQINDYVRGLKSIYDQGGEAQTVAITKARRLSNMFGGGELTGQRTGILEGLKTIGTTTAISAGTGAAAGSIIPGVGTAAGAIAGTAGGAVASIGIVATDAVANLLGYPSETVAKIKSTFNETQQILQQMSSGK